MNPKLMRFYAAVALTSRAGLALTELPKAIEEGDDAYLQQWIEFAKDRLKEAEEILKTPEVLPAEQEAK